ncbi:PHP domain-containing protein [Mailhella massiliensis]|uniref:PHP domain-containing protein n=1 Tax=Mailhella massiliensis TaxID=1903261 RepID=UPI00097D1E32|nr:PHP domain-containing protein [Mailhella massiliensis]
MSMTFIDLHTHSTASDGTDSPADLVRKAAQAHLAVLALTDHDTLAGLDEAEEEAKQRNIVFVRGCEISTATPWGEAHFLGLWIPEEPEKTARLEAALEKVRMGRKERNLRIAEKLRALGLDVSYEAAEALAGGAVVGRPHFAALLCSMGVVKDRREAFRQYLGKDGLAYEPRRLMSPGEAVSLLKSTGAVVSMAHPRLLHAPVEELNHLVAGLKEQGLDALEAYHSEHDAGDVRLCVELAARYDLQLSGGSDYHGLAKPNIGLGRGKGGLRVGLGVYDELMRYRALQGGE